MPIDFTRIVHSYWSETAYAEKKASAYLDLLLSEIAATYGFYDEYHFGKCFKKVIGRSPKRSK